MQANDPSSGLFAVDHSSLAMFKECPRKYYYAIVEGRRPKTAAAPLVFGAAYHDGLETFERSMAAGATRHEALRAAIRKAIKYELTSDDSARTRATLIRALVWHEAHYRSDFVQVITLPNGKPAVELSFRVELPFTFSHSDAPVIYCGHIDSIVSYQGRLFAMEHKHTKSALNEHYWQRYVFSSQISGYVLAAEANFAAEIGGAIIDATQVGVNFARFGRRVAARVKAHQEEWLLDLHYWLTQLDMSFAANRWPHNHESCGKYGGCQFRSVCFANPSVRDVVLRDEFKIERWDPLRVRGEED
jgi:hypothetical protein